MAFCPNCGTPNTDQAEKCVSCAFDLAPKQKAKFKGTIMMSGVQAPIARPPAAGAQPPAPQAAPAPAAQAAPAPQPAGGGARNLAFEKTMIGNMAPPVAPPPGMAPAAAAAQDTADLARAATVEGPAPVFTPPAQPAPYSAPAQMSAGTPAQPASTWGGSASSSGTGGSFGSTTGGGFGGGGGGGYDDAGALPGAPKSSTGKILAIGCAAVLVLACVIGGLLYVVAREKLNAMFGALDKEGSALEWRGSLAQSLTQVAALCPNSCASAGVYFHPDVQSALMDQAKQLTPTRVQKLIDPTQSEARMLNATDDTAIAQKLNLDPTQCVRVVSGGAKVVGCSVPDPNGTASLRIVAMSGIETL